MNLFISLFLTLSTFYWAANISGWTGFLGYPNSATKKKGGRSGLVLWLAMLSEAFHIYVFQLKMASVLFLDPLFSYFFVSVHISWFEI